MLATPIIKGVEEVADVIGKAIGANRPWPRETYSDDEVRREAADNFYSALVKFPPTPEIPTRDITVVCLDVGKFDEAQNVERYFRGIYHSVNVVGIGNNRSSFSHASHSIKYIDGNAAQLEHLVKGKADIIITRNPSVMADSSLWINAYNNAIYETLNNGGKLVATFVTEHEAKLVADKIKYKFNVKTVTINPFATNAKYEVSRKFANKVRDNLRSHKHDFEQAGLSIEEVIKKLESKVGELTDFELDRYILIAVKNEDDAGNLHEEGDNHGHSDHGKKGDDDGEAHSHGHHEDSQSDEGHESGHS